MNGREHDDELERMRARAARNGSRQHRPGSTQSPRPDGSAQRIHEEGDLRRGHEDFDEEYYYGEEYGNEAGLGYGESREDCDIIAGDRTEPSNRRKSASRSQNGASRQGRDSIGSDGRKKSPASSSRPQAGIGRPQAGAGRPQAGIGRPQAGAGKARTGAGKRISVSRERDRAAAGRQQEQMTKRRKKSRWKGILLVLLAVFIGYGAWLFLHRPTGCWNIAVFGVDSRDGNTKNALADVQMICSIDRSTGEIRLVSVYRDTYLKINSEGTYHKINEAYFKGGHKQAVSALEENLDIKIDDYAAFNWKAVAEAINILGGVDLEITPAEFGMINGFITETVNSTGIGSVQLTQAGMNHLDGVQAVAYSRLRLMDTDFQRTERQRKVVQLALEKAKQADVATLSSLAGYLIPEISTSIGVDDVLPLVKDIGKYHIGETGGFPFSRQNMRIGKMDCVVPSTLESNVILLHQFLYGEDVSYSPSSSVKKISSHISEETGIYEEGKVAPSGSSSGGSSGGGSSSGGQAPAQPAPAETPPETTAPPESTEATIEETEETTEEETLEETEETEETEEVGPGVSGKPTKVPETTAGPDDDHGPGADGPSGTDTAKPSASHTTKESNTEESNTKESNTKESNTKESNTKESSAKAPEISEPGQGPGSAEDGSGQEASDTQGPGEGGPGL